MPITISNCPSRSIRNGRVFCLLPAFVVRTRSLPYAWKLKKVAMGGTLRIRNCRSELGGNRCVESFGYAPTHLHERAFVFP